MIATFYVSSTWLLCLLLEFRALLGEKLSVPKQTYVLANFLRTEVE